MYSSPNSNDISYAEYAIYAVLKPNPFLLSEIGYGWSLSIPTIREEDGSSGNAILLHMGDGRVYSLTKGSEETKFEFKGNSNVEMTLELHEENISEAGLSKYKLVTKEKIEWLFNSRGKVIAKRNRFGDTIKYLYPPGLNMEIIDTYNRRIQIKHEYMEKTVAVYSNGTELFKWRYKLDWYGDAAILNQV